MALSAYNYKNVHSKQAKTCTLRKLIRGEIWFLQVSDSSTKNASCTVEWVTLKAFMTFVHIETHKIAHRLSFQF